MKLFICFFGIGMAFHWLQTAHGIELESEHTESPYFQVHGSQNTEAFPLQSTDVDVQISGVIANVKVTQVYQNRGDTKLEAVYVFPGSTRAAIHGLEMKIGNRILKALVKEKQSARKIYEEAKAANQTASLLEQKRPNVFQMQVANILPGDTIEVILQYTEHLIPEERTYQFVYPAVVAPRYSHSGGENWTENPHLEIGRNGSTFNVDLSLGAGMPIHGIRCDTHETQTDFESRDEAVVTMKGDKTTTGNRDYILRYRLADKRIDTGLLLHEGGKDKENFFLLTVQPPQRIEKKEVLPREYIFVVDVSGSMSGFPLNTAKVLMENMVSELKKQDRFNILAFANGQHLYANQSVEGSKINLSDALRWINSLNGRGGTEMVSALQKALSLPQTSDNVSRIIVVITDGLVSFEKEAFEMVRQNLGKANLFAFGIGSSINRHLIEGISLAGHGEPFIVTEPKRASLMADRFRSYVSAPLMTNVKLQFEGLELYDVTPQTVPDVFANRPITIYGKWRGKPKGKVVLLGKTPMGTIELKQEISERKATKEPALPYLWARQKVRELDDFNGGALDEDAKRGIINLGLTYNLMTRYTSFVAVDDQPRKTHQNTKPFTVTQAAPQPHGVTGGSTPGPGLIPLILVGLASLFGKRFFNRNQE